MLRSTDVEENKRFGLGRCYPSHHMACQVANNGNKKNGERSGGAIQKDSRKNNNRSCCSLAGRAQP